AAVAAGGLPRAAGAVRAGQGGPRAGLRDGAPPVVGAAAPERADRPDGHVGAVGWRRFAEASHADASAKRRETSPGTRVMKPLPEHVPSGVTIEGVKPEIDDGRFPAKRTAGEDVTVSADVHTDGHDALAVVLRFRRACSGEWTETAMAPLGNDRW